MVEKTLHKARRVERNELMQHAIRQALFGQCGGSDRALRHQYYEMLRAEPFDQRDDRQHLADTCAVYPNERTDRAGDARLTEPFRHAFGMFLAAL